jgi:hypothetical protein
MSLATRTRPGEQPCLTALPSAPPNKPLKQTAAPRRDLHTVSLSPVMNYHGLARPYLMPPRLLLWPLLNSGTLGRRTMTLHTLYAYVDGADLHDVQALLRSEFEAFVGGRKWSRKTWVVNQRHSPDPADRPGDLPLWDLGLNHELPDPGTEPRDWFEEVEAIALFLGALTEKSEREFCIGIAHNETGLAEDLLFIRSVDANLSRLRTIVGCPTRRCS